MGLFKTVLSLLFVFYFATKAESAFGDHDQAWLQKMKSQFPRFSYLGEVEGKKFYVDFTLRNWDASVKFCEDMGMSIARVQKQTEGLFLRDTLPTPPNIDLHAFWVDGEDVRNASQFKYESGDAYETEIEMRFHRHSCVAFIRWQSGHFFSENHNLCPVSLSVLCQS